MTLSPGYYERNPTKWLIRYVAYYASYEGLMRIRMTPGRSFYQEAWSHFVIGIKHMYGISTFREAASKAKQVCEETPLTMDPIDLWKALPRTKREEEDALYQPTNSKMASLAEKPGQTSSIEEDVRKEYALTKAAFDTTLDTLYKRIVETSSIPSRLLYMKHEAGIQKLGDLISSLCALGEHIDMQPCPLIVNAVRNLQASLQEAKESPEEANANPATETKKKRRRHVSVAMKARLARDYQMAYRVKEAKRRRLAAACDERPQRIEASTATRRIPLL